jgi:hypothetical protein
MMSKFKLLFCVASWLIIAAISSNALGGFVLQFSLDNTVQSINVNAGDTFAVDVYIAETGLETRLSSDGLLGYGLRSEFNTSLLTAVDAESDNAFPLVGSPESDNSIAGQIDIFGASFAPPTGNVIRLARFNFIANTAGTTTIAFGDLDPSFSDFTLNDSPNFTDIDSDLFGSNFTNQTNFVVNIQAIPEPNSVLLCTVIASVAPLMRRLRKHLK